uniref:PP1-binding domain-containing protein n=1 Tax=Astatotilapia calliptera TaxID=8154 RepID=A0A3P8NMA7_ASTCA
VDVRQSRAVSPPSVEDTPSVLNQTSAPLNFSELTPSQFGISVQSFTPAASSNRKDKSRLAQLKARRRSSVGVRGSPETNSLICFMAQQKRKTPPASQTPELVRSSPFLPRVASTLRQKMASFQSLMDVEENDACDPVPAQDSNTGGCIKTRDYLSGEAASFLSWCLLHNDSWRKESTFLCIVWIFYLAGEEESNGTPTTMTKKKKRVRFGGPLSPEFFDKNLPPSTPLQKGGTPARPQTPGGSLHLRSVLKTPQSESKTPECRPDFSSPTAFGASPTLTMPCKSRMHSEGDEEEGKVDEIKLCCQYDDYTLHLPEESEPVKRSARSAAKLASGKMKMTSSTTRRWNKDVDRSLYGSREYASKNPALSPITERLSFISQSPTAQETPSISCKGKKKEKKVASVGNQWKHFFPEIFLLSSFFFTAPDQETQLNPEVTNETQVIHDLAVTNASETTVEISVTSPSLSEKSAGQDSRLLGVRVRGRRLKKRKVSVADSDLTRGETEQQLYEEQTTTSLELSTRTPSVHEERQEDTVELCAQTSADTPCTESEYPVSEERQGDRAASSQENIQSSSDSQEEGETAHVDLAPWQADFNFEDVFKPVCTRGQRSVRRSLRNQSNAENSSSAGLTWLPRTSPESSKETRRRTRGRRLSAALPSQPKLTSNLHPSSSGY